MRRLLSLAAGLTLASCSPTTAPAQRYDELLQCEMRVLVVAKFHPSLDSTERMSMNEKLKSLSDEVMATAGSLEKSSAEIAVDQQRILKNLQSRIQGSSGDVEADKLVEEAKHCTS